MSLTWNSRRRPADPALDPLQEPRVRRLLLSMAVGFGLLAFVLAFGDMARDLDYAKTIQILRKMRTPELALAIAMTAISYAGVLGREFAALRFVGAKPPRLAVLLGALSATALGNVAGFGFLTGAAVRYRIYGAVGVKTFDVARIVGFVMAGFVLGLALVGGGASILRAHDVAAIFGWSPTTVTVAGAAALSGVLALIVVGATNLMPFWGALFTPANRGLIALEALWTAVRLIGAAAALWALLPPGQIGFLSLVPLFAAATAIAALSHVPAGAGVFELIVLAAFRGRAPNEAIAAALIAYRAIYFMLPLLASAATLAAFELRVAFDPKMPRADAKLARAASRLTPTFVGVLAFAIGIVLIVSGATPTFDKRLTALSHHVPLWTMEMSSLLGSVLGVAFLFLTRGLLDRRDGAWRLAMAATVASLAFALLKGLAFGEAALLAAFLTLLLATRGRFDRPTSLFDQPFTLGWFLAVSATLASAFGVMWLAFHDAPAQIGDLWSFAFDAQAPRALRAVLGAAFSVAGLAFWQLLRAPSGRTTTPSPASLALALTIIEAQPRSEAMMAMMGDKALLFSASGRAFLMYGKRGRSWIALYDPVGPREEWRELVEAFVRLAAKHGGRANIYQARPESLSFYLDLGFSATKLGEEAVVDLEGFTLKGGAFSALRYALKRGERDGLALEWLNAAEIAARYDELAAVSNEWLEARRGEEKGFSVAAFDPAFLSTQRVALLTEKGKAVAFASVMTTGREATLGLLRSAEPESPVAMEFLTCRMCSDLRERGLARFSLGAAPLAGVERGALATRWSRLAEFVWRHGDRFYRFQGLRAFKNKFGPTWEPRYFVTSGALGPFVGLADAVALIRSRVGKGGDAVNV